ncbi:hypothetical protein PuT2_05685 [Pusillimonas sp. T2]|nr:hypothetical protein PuT2_05685 [Pusillimonas sp. T2]
MAMPTGWNWLKYDQRNIRNIAKAHGGARIATYPSIGTLQYIWATYVQGIKWASILDLMSFNKAAAMSSLVDRYGYKPYPYKHYESVFTRFYQGYLLPQKFGVDKRRLHLSTLIISGQMTRQAAEEDLRSIPYPSTQDLHEDTEYFLKKMGWTAAQLKNYLDRPEQPHANYASEQWLWDALKDAYLTFRSHMRKA